MGNQSALSALAILVLLPISTVYGWTAGRATMYAAPYDPWQLGMGACMYGYLDRNKCTGWDVAALSDQFPGYNSDTKNCGVCYEVRCRSADFNDGYGEFLGRKDVCFGHGGSVVVQVVDQCECNYAPNAFSNRRWCCGDMPHMDLSVWSFEKLADKKWGVIAIEYQQVDCGTKPSTPAYLPDGYTESIMTEQKPNGWNGGDGRSCNGATSSTNRRTRPRLAPSNARGVKVSTWNMNRWRGTGVTGRAAQACGTVLPYGGMTLSGSYSGKKAISFWVQKNSNGVPDVSIKASGNGACKSRSLRSFRPVGTRGNYQRYVIKLSQFGCSGVRKVVINNSWRWQTLCVDIAKIL